jgi:hypothetical protein
MVFTWYTSNKRAKGDDDYDSKGSSNRATQIVIERDTVIQLLQKKKKKSDSDEFEDFLVMGIYNKNYNKHYNKYFLVNQDMVKPTWMSYPKMKSSKC